MKLLDLVGLTFRSSPTNHELLLKLVSTLDPNQPNSIFLFGLEAPGEG